MIGGTLAPRLAAAQPEDGSVVDPQSAFDWTLGRWEGVRRAADDGSEAAMTLRVEAILGGAGQQRHLEIATPGGFYRGFAVQVYDPELGRWVRQYVNAVRGRFVRLEGEIEANRSVWRSTTQGRSRESRLVSERPSPDRWRRSLSVSEDGGKTWRLLWEDDLRRVEDSERAPAR